MTPISTNWEEFPTYFDVLTTIHEFLNGRYRKELVVKTNKDYVPILYEWIYYNFYVFDAVLVIICAIIWTVLRYLCTEQIFKPLGRKCNLTTINQDKMPESAWKFTYYLFAWSYNCYVLILSGEYMFFQKPSTVWKGWSLNESLPTKMYILYVTQCGFYFHSLYASMFLDAWRKDSYPMLIHHFSALTLILLSFFLRCHNIGAYVLFFHDICDIFLEFSKINVYFKMQGGETIKIHEVLANITFFCFTLVWYTARLYWFPLRVLYNAMSNVPGSLLMNILLWILQILNIYWSYFIVQVLLQVLTGKYQEAGDMREYDTQNTKDVKETPIQEVNSRRECEVKNKLARNKELDLSSNFYECKHLKRSSKEGVVMTYCESAM